MVLKGGARRMASYRRMRIEDRVLPIESAMLPARRLD